MRFLSRKYCTDCGVKQSLLNRLTATDYTLCDNCYFQLTALLRGEIYIESNNDEARFNRANKQVL